MPIHLTTSTNQTIPGDKTFTGLISAASGFTFPDGSIQSTAFTNNLSAYAELSYVNNNFLNLSGGTVTGATRFDSNVTIFGNLSCSGTQIFNNTVFSTTSAVSVVHVGSGPALWVGNNGTGDIASFYDIDQNVEVLHVGGNNGTFPNVGVKTSTPNVDFTVNGEISASSTIYSLLGNSNQWNSGYSTVQTNSATTWNYQGTDVKNLTGDWQNTYNIVSSTSANWNDTTSVVQSNSAQWAADSTTDTEVRALTSNWQNTYTVFSGQSANNASVSSTVAANSATTWNYQGTDVKSLTANWQNTYTNFSTQSANNESVYSTVNANSATWGTGGGGTIDTGVRALTANWESTYTTVQSNSSTWGSGGGSFIVEDANSIIGLSVFL